MTVTVDEIVQLRVGGLPVETARDLASPGALEWAERVLGARARVAELREGASDQLAGHVRGAPDGLRKELVQIRRAVFNGRRADRAIAALPTGLAEVVAAVVEPVRRAEAELAELEAAGRTSFPDWLVGERRRLASLLEDEDFSDGLAVAVPGAGRSLRAYPRKGVVAVPNKQMRKCERSLMSYAMRAAAKASPFSTFTPTALTSFTAGAPGWERLPSRPRRHSRWSIYPVARALGGLREDRRRLQGLPLRLSRTVQPRSDGGLDVVRSVYEYKDSHRGEDYATCEQSVVRLRQSEVCRIVTDLLGEGTLVFETVVAGLAERAGLTRERAGEALARLVRLGLVEVDGLDL
ncbi:MAG: lantibiotic dehydratase, partial [Actinomyces dentalis]